MSHSSTTALLGILQRHGFTPDVLEVLIHHCEQKKNGSVTFHMAAGKVQSYEVHEHGKVQQLRKSHALTKM